MPPGSSDLVLRRQEAARPSRDAPLEWRLSLVGPGQEMARPASAVAVLERGVEAVGGGGAVYEEETDTESLRDEAGGTRARLSLPHGAHRRTLSPPPPSAGEVKPVRAKNASPARILCSETAKSWDDLPPRGASPSDEEWMADALTKSR